MDDAERQTLDKEVRRLKRIAAEAAGQLHDLVEDRLPAAYAELPAVAEHTYAVCKAWAEAEARLRNAPCGKA
ncbi:MAG: hypothetical protein CGU28_08220 [Candidatus Dactylopiibacterium carminicum]|uniref:Rop family plasmid primer RNA-binding protein n=1 Tax=Candidatus Dactylopiibacterium carminicum TaxID=857335 RepID=A0A272ET86_9RHOO|nr:CCE_0567 family metalloprotein [Candidatus Dactylopiibacterium carminicum]KAF7598983.1 hypothetical protein BGI27_10250 [Candidatus Dactylopiibacterium carminicum]PAS92950.1 MAG: hypothetical protein CGU29_09600 [Candidatus Dactylopiibacterium carminicum]PAS96600.1 MAG: hypothetical protein CGU28_08220 [Candidatus Dactylopiibacterium carminicum]PAS98995.1 MAG: hypothetical protein BSR46_10285 [Candidatus Dactylopiibacterium carminicum]